MEPAASSEVPSDAVDTYVPTDEALDAWIAELRTDTAARSRSAVGAMKAVAADDATVVGVLADLRERDAQVLLTTTAGRRHRGQVLLVGPDALVLRVGTGEWLVTRLASVASVRMVGGDLVSGEGSPSSASSFGRILGAAATPGEWIRISTGGEAFGGTVVAVSAEVAVMRLDNGDLTYVNLDAVEEASLTSGGR
jgi:hypothetical protein